jgi:hypothetical protein
MLTACEMKKNSRNDDRAHHAASSAKQRGKSASGGTDLWAHGYGRAALERMMRIHRKIEDREYPNCSKMSEKFEVSVRNFRTAR